MLDNIDKIVFSRTIKSVGWKNARLATAGLSEEVLKLKALPGKNIEVGGAGILIDLMNLDLIDEYQFHLQPIILGSGLPLFKNIKDRVDLRLIETKPHGSGVITLRYERTEDRR